MLEQLKILKEIDLLDMEKIKLANQQKVLPVQIQTFKSKVIVKKEKFEQIKQQIAEAEAFIETFKRSVENEKILLEKSSVRLNSISTNKEYDAVQSEIATHQRRIEEWENSELEKIELLETLHTQLPEIEKEYIEVSNKYKPEVEKLVTTFNGIKSNNILIDEKIASLKVGLDARMVGYYEKLLKSKYTLLLTHKQSNIVGEMQSGMSCCSICGSELRKPRIQAIRKNDSITCCDDCGSILIWNEA